MTDNPITIAEYARSKGISPQAVRMAVKAGRLTKSLMQNEKGRLRIDPEAADLEWAANTKHQHAPKPQGIATGAEIGDMDENYNKSRAKREMYQAELARLEYEEKQGTLVNAESIKKEAFRVARNVRDGLLNIPDRVAAELAAETDQFIVHRKLTEEIRKTLVSILGESDEKE